MKVKSMLRVHYGCISVSVGLRVWGAITTDYLASDEGLRMSIVMQANSIFVAWGGILGGTNERIWNDARR